MLQVQEGDTALFDLLLARYRTPLVNFLYRMVHDRSIAEELAQDVFLRVFRSRDRYKPTAKFTTWLFRIAINVALNWRRDRSRKAAHIHLDERPTDGRQFEVADARPTVEENAIKRSKRDEIRVAVMELPFKQRTAVILHKYEGMEHTQIAASLGCTVPAVKSLLFRAYERLRLRLAHMDR